jgi:hypothetical protein
VFEAFYQSAWQHPGLLFAACALGALVVFQQRARVDMTVRHYAIALVVLAVLDAWLTSNDIPLVGALPGVLATAIPVAFVILGDLRYLLLAEVMTDSGELRFPAAAFARAIAWSLLVPVLAQLVVRFVLYSTEGRVLFLTYETLFFALILARLPYTRARLGDGAAFRWHRKLDALALGWYGTWILADVLILGFDLDVGYLARVVPNVLYYGALPAVLVRAAPPRPVAP